MVKIGVTSLSTGLNEIGFPHWCAKRKIHLLRGTVEQRLETLKGDAPIEFVLEVLNEEQLLVDPIGMRYGGPGNVWWEDDWTQTDGLRCDFGRSMRPVSARLKVCRGGATIVYRLVLRLRLSALRVISQRLMPAPYLGNIRLNWPQ